MSYYKLPETIYHEIEDMLAKFWWGSKNGERKVHWMSWDKVTRAKDACVMGFRGINDFNTSLLDNHYWFLLLGDHTLLGKVFKKRYFPRSSIEDNSVVFSPSYALRSILSANELIQ